MGKRTHDELVVEISEDQLQSRFDKDLVKKNLLTTLIGEIQLEASKPKGKDVTGIVNKFIKDIDLMIKTRTSPELLLEKKYMEKYLDDLMSEDEIRQVFIEYGATNMGDAMKYLKSVYGGEYNGKVASDIAKAMYL